MRLHPTRSALALAALAAVLLPLLAPAAGAEEASPPATSVPAGFDAGSPNPEAPEELDLFGRFAGAWRAEIRVIQDDGTFPEAGKPALWTFRYILDGRAIQDEWISPPPGEPVTDEPRSYGTGLRIYNPAEDHWEMAWISTTQPFVSTFEARPDGESGIVMLGEHPTGNPSRTTFYDVEDGSFSWTLELQGVGSDPDAWIEVARLRAVRVQ